jgi:predicted permease
MTPLDTLVVVAPVFLVLGAGTLAVRTGRFSHDHGDGLMDFGQNFAIPCLLFRALSKLDLSAVFDLRLLASFYIGSAMCFLIGATGAVLLCRRSAADAVVLGFSSLYCNAVLLGRPCARCRGERGVARDAPVGAHRHDLDHAAARLTGRASPDVQPGKMAMPHRDIRMTQPDLWSAR